MKKKRKIVFAAVLALCFCLLTAMTAYADDAPAFTVDVPASVMVSEGDTLSLSVTVSGENLSYQWYKNNLPVDGQTGPSFTEAGITSASSGAQYFCYVQNPFGGASSTVCTLYVSLPVHAPEMTQNVPGSASANVGDVLTVTAAASGENVTAQWYLRSGGVSRPIGGQTSPTLTLTMTEELNGADVYCQFTNPAGSIVTGLCRLTVGPEPSPSPSDEPPRTTKDPTGENPVEGGQAIFIARADNATGFTWRLISPDNSVILDYNNLGGRFPGLMVSGGNTEILTLSNIPVELDGWKVACVFEGPGGKTVSGEARIAVERRTSTISVINQPMSASMAIDERPEFTLSIQAAASNGGTLTYQWYSAPSNSAAAMKAIPGATNSSYKPERTEGTTYYRVSVTLTANNKVSDPIFSSIVPVTFTASKVHVHSYSTIWEHNDISHWHQCTCGDHADEDFHDYQWTVIKAPTASEDGQQRGVCTVCGYETVQPIPAGSGEEPDGSEQTTPAPAKTETGRSSRGFWGIALGALAVAVVAGAVILIRRVLREEDEYEDDEEYEDEEE